MSVATSMRAKRSGRSHSDKFRQRFEVGVPVSYTHLTLPTIYSV